MARSFKYSCIIIKMKIPLQANLLAVYRQNIVSPPLRYIYWPRPPTHNVALGLKAIPSCTYYFLYYTKSTQNGHQYHIKMHVLLSPSASYLALKQSGVSIDQMIFSGRFSNIFYVSHQLVLHKKLKKGRNGKKNCKRLHIL